MTTCAVDRQQAQRAADAPGVRQGKTFAEFFAGIGLMDEGLRPLGWQCVYANDNAPRKQQMHAARNGAGACYHLEDVCNTQAVFDRIPGSPFLTTASFPCVDLSLAGNYRGFDGRHSSTFFAFIDVLKALGDRRPRVVMLENVVGFLSARQGADFKTAATTLADLGYWLDVFVLDAAHFVPQSRPRVFVIAVADGLQPAPPHGLPSWAAPLHGPTPLRPASVLRLLNSLELPTGWAPFPLPDPPRRQVKLADVIDLDDAQEWWEPADVQRHYQMMSDLHRQRIDEKVCSGECFVGTIFRRVRADGQRAEIRFDGLAGCLRTPRGGSGRQIVITTDEGRLRMRWMSPREYGRLQGVADFPLTLSKNQLLFGFADAVCVPAISWIDRHVLTPLYEAAISAPSKPWPTT